MQATASVLLNRLMARARLRHMQVLVQLAELGSVRRAAQAVGMTQPGVSQILADLERMLDVTLFHRHARGVRPTPACTDVLPLARQMLLGLAASAEAVSARRDLGQGVVRLIASTSAINGLLVRALPEFIRANPAIQVQVREGERDDQMLAIAGAQIMAGVNSTGFAPWVDRGQIRLLATFNATRNPRWPDAPTMRELGYPQAVYTSPWGLAAPAGTPEAAVQKLHEVFRRAMNAERHTSALAKYDQSLDYLNTRDYRQAVLATVEREKKLLARMNLLARTAS